MRGSGGRVTAEGHVAPRFRAVRDAFAANLEEHDDVGAACAVYVGGRPVVDIWAGYADLDAGRRWREDTVQLVFSATKGVTAVCAHLLVERGLLDLDAPVAVYWPEFAAAGKARLPVRWVLSHRAGLPVVDGEFTLREVLAAKPSPRSPWWPRSPARHPAGNRARRTGTTCGPSAGSWAS
jgi:CubicO group peptidase (beta-lactamase class C family)